MTLQQVHEHIRQHLLAQNRKAEDGITAVLHSPNGTKCAIGHCIDDDEYSPDLEEELITAPEIEGAIEASGYWPQNVPSSTAREYFRTVQMIHDFTPVPLWAAQFEALATRFRLTPQTTTA